MSEKTKAIDLIRRFYQLVANRNHKQLVQQLLGLVMRLPDVSKVVLVIAEGQQLRVRGIANSEKELLVVDCDLDRLPKIPQDFIRQTYRSQKLSFRNPPCDDIKIDQYHPESKTLAALPVIDDGLSQGLLYIESKLDLEQLSDLHDRFKPLIAFEGLLLRHLNMVWQHESQLDQIRVAEKALWASDAYLHSILEHSPLIISIKDLDGNIVLSSKHHDEDESSKHIKAVTAALWNSSAAMAHQESETELRIGSDGGEIKTYLVTRFPLRNRQTKVFAYCAICTDISERKAAELEMKKQQMKLNYMAFHDDLTGLPNRSLFQERMMHSLSHAQRDESRVAVMLLDLDRFKYVNDSFGHDAGDALLKELSERLLMSVRETDTVARLGGDEFVIVLEGIHSNNDIRCVADKLLTATAHPVFLRGHEITCTVSIGISIYPQDGDNVEELLKHADVAMYKAKEAGKNNFKHYNFEMNAKAVDSLLLENDLRRAIKTNNLSLAYQPKLSLVDGRITGVEALLRWQHPERGAISPAEFIPLAEETGLIVPLGEWVLQAACEQQAAWHKDGFDVGSVAVNLSPLQLRQDDLPGFIAGILERTGLDPKYLELELTETSAMENAEETIVLLKQLSDMGLSLSVDDFGTGYSSMAYLKRLPVTTLKIDRSFTDDLSVGGNDSVIAKAIIDLGHNMGLKVVAEGVETQQQESWLRNNNCDQAQGFYYSRPVPAVALAETLGEINHRVLETENYGDCVV